MSTRTSLPVRRRWLLAGAAALAVVVAGCGGPADTPAAPQAQAPQQGTGLPVTIDHALGSTTITAPPQRVVTVGWSDQDAVLALGVTPVGTAEWFNEQPGAIFPWATQAAGGAVPEIVSNAGEISFEKVAALKPDLILALYEGLDQSEYDKLSAIAPTVAQSKQFDEFGAPWQDMTLTAGKALGREQQAKELVADTEAKFEAVRDAHPEWAQKTMLVGATAENGTYTVFSPQDPKVRFFADLGFRTQPPWLAGRVADNVATVSAEEYKLLDVDRLAWTSDPDLMQVLRDDPIYNRLDVVRSGRVSYFDYTTAPFPGAAITFTTVLSIPYALDQVVPELERMDAKQ
ncbi:iron-siderophore ABC transporter substrate-binding protein [Pseudonocardia yuanmonensis]|uniref:Iron-siderophore ABC transporter substrate-binding protein n=1 Tax=Pseudonocardia yuanmonensis TaxID=1095914 RepID=A0ABP8X7G0_9PSEU